MEVGLTFGSIGDIIVLCQLAVQLRRALGNAAGSAKQYQDLRSDLDAFVNILMHVIGTYEQRAPSPWMDGLDSATRAVVDDCSRLIQESLDDLGSRYGDSLTLGGSGPDMAAHIRDTCKKIEFSVREKNRLALLRERLRTNTERLNLLVALATQKSARVDNATMMARIDQVNEALSRQQRTQEYLVQLHDEQVRLCKDQNQQLSIMKEHLESQSQASWATVKRIGDVFGAISAVREMLGQVMKIATHLQALASNSTVPMSLDPTREMPVYFEDALGNILAIPIGWIHDWESFHELVQLHFKNRKGHEKVLKMEYILEENCTGNDLDMSQPFPYAFRKGMKINMSMVFDDFSFHQRPLFCPRCKGTVERAATVSIACQNQACEMLVRVVTADVSKSGDVDIAFDFPKLKAAYNGQVQELLTKVLQEYMRRDTMVRSKLYRVKSPLIYGVDGRDLWQDLISIQSAVENKLARCSDDREGITHTPTEILFQPHGSTFIEENMLVLSEMATDIEKALRLLRRMLLSETATQAKEDFDSDYLGHLESIIEWVHSSLSVSDNPPAGYDVRNISNFARFIFRLSSAFVRNMETSPAEFKRVCFFR